MSASDSDTVPLSHAVAASSAIPLFFRPVRIEGRDYIDGSVGKVAHLDLAIKGAGFFQVQLPDGSTGSPQSNTSMWCPLFSGSGAARGRPGCHRRYHLVDQS